MTSADAEAWPAPAKLNLFIHVLGRREDGFHDIQTLFQFLEAGDRLYFQHRDDGRIRLDAGDIALAEEENLVLRAARMLQEHSGSPNGADIRLEKHLPLGSGLGGGSSDAATTLHALNRLWDLDLSVEELAALGLELGADVPVFIHGRAAWGEGLGERLEPADPPEPWYVIITPPCRVSTAAMYQDEDLRRDSERIDMETFLAGRGRNDFQPVVAARHTPVSEALRWLASFGEARLTGTGACVYLAVDSRQAGERILERLPADWRGFVTRGRNRSVLLDRL